MIFVELCAGSAAVSLRWLSSRAKPPLSYQGGKRGYADAILRAMGQSPGAGRGHDVVLCEPGPWGEAWDLWRTTEGRADTRAQMEAWAAEDPRTLWERLRRAPVPGDMAERVATWAVLQWWSWGRKPVIQTSGTWASRGGGMESYSTGAMAFNAAEAYRGDYGRKAKAERGTWANGVTIHVSRDMTLGVLLEGMAALPDLSRARVQRGRAQTLSPIPGALCYIDPPYDKTTGYGCAFPRAEVLAVAQRWREAGALVVVSEAEPLPLPGWHHHELGGSFGPGRTWSKQQREVLTMSSPPSGQMGLPMREERS